VRASTTSTERSDATAENASPVTGHRQIPRLQLHDIPSGQAEAGGAATGRGVSPPPITAAPVAQVQLAPKLLVPNADAPPHGTTIQVPDADHPSRRDIEGEPVIQTDKTIAPGQATPPRGKSWKSLAEVAESINVQDDRGDTLHIDITYRLESRPAEVGEVPDIWIHTERKALLTIGSGEHAGATIVGQARIRLAPGDACDPKAAIAKPSIGPDHWAQIYLAEAEQYVNLHGAGGRASLLADAAGDDVLVYDDPLRTLIGLKTILKQQHVAGHGGDVAKMHARSQRMLADAKRGRVVLEREMSSVASFHDPNPGRVAPVRFLIGDITQWLAANQRAGRDGTEDANQLRKARAELEHLLADAEHAHAPKRDQLDDALNAPVRFAGRTAEGVGEVGAMVVDAVVLGVDTIGEATGIGTFDYHPISKYGKAIDETGSNTTTALVTMVNGFADEWTDAIERAKHGDYRSLTDVSIDTLMMIDGARTGGVVALNKGDALAAKLSSVAKSAHAIASGLPAEARDIAVAMADGADAFVARLRAGGMQMSTAGGGGGPGPNLGGMSAETLAEAAQAAKEAFKDKRLAQDAAKQAAAAHTDTATSSPGGSSPRPDPELPSSSGHAPHTDAASPHEPGRAPHSDTATADARPRTRLAELASTGLDNAQIRALGADFTDAQLTTLETVMSRKWLAAFYASPDMGKAGLTVIHDCAINPNIRGLKEWVAFESAKTDTTSWRRDLGELREAQRATKADPSEIVNVANDARTPTKTGKYSPRGAPERAESFDQTVTDAATGAAKRSIEITSVSKPVTGPGDISSGIEHATVKIEKRLTTPVDAPGHASGTPLPIPGSKEVVIQVNLFRGELDPTTGALAPASGTAGSMPTPTAGRKSVMFDGLGGYEYNDYVPQRPAGAAFKPRNYHGEPNPGNVLDNVLASLNAISTIRHHCSTGFAW
jgi:hypothetical protein